MLCFTSFELIIVYENEGKAIYDPRVEIELIELVVRQNKKELFPEKAEYVLLATKHKFP